jgi:RHS repeat-associated protein
MGILLAAMISAAGAASAQDAPLPINQVGLPSNGVFSGGSIDSVQLNNGNLHVDIPLLHLPGIGMDTDIHFVYDNKVWTYVYSPTQNLTYSEGYLGGSGNTGVQIPAFTTVYTSRGLWNYEDPLSASVTEGTNQIYFTCVYPGDNVTNYYWLTNVTQISFTDGNGTNHAFPLSGTPTSIPQSCVGINPYLEPMAYAQDSSGYLATTNSIGTVASVTDKHGRKYIFNQTVLPAPNTGCSDCVAMDPYTPVAVEDTNGNRITLSGTPPLNNSFFPSTYTLTDTVNRTITAAPGLIVQDPYAYNGPIPYTGPLPYTTIQYLDEYDNTQIIKIYYTVVQFNYPLMCESTPSPSQCSQGGDPGGTATVQNVWLPSSFVLQNGDTYAITYNSSGYGEIASITLPTGGVISYTYGNWDGTGEYVLSRTVTANDVSSTWNYSYYIGIPPGQTQYTPPQLSSISTVTDPYSNETVYTCTGYVPTNYVTPTPYAPGVGPCYMTKEQIYSGSAASGTLLATKTTGYTTTGYAILPTSETFTWNATGQTSETDTVWDQEADIPGGSLSDGTNYAISYGNVLSKSVYDFGAAGSNTHGPLLSSTQYSYLHNQNSAYLAANMLDRVTGVSVYNSASSLVAQTTTAYDTGSLSPTTGTKQHDTNYSAAYILRGLPTSVTKYTGASSAPITTYAYYNDLGNKVSTIDGRGYSTSYAYNNAPGAQNAFLAATTMPSTGNGVAHVITTNYDTNTGLLIWQEDYNGTVTGKQTTYTYDSRMRPLCTYRPDGGSTCNAYSIPNSYPYQVITTVTESPSPSKVTTTILDGVGRTISVITAADTACVSLTVDTTYDLMSRVSTVSNPHCNSSQATDGLTQSAYDAIGRLLTKTNPDGSAKNWVYTGSMIDSYDEVFNHWRHTYNAVGWLTQVLEPPGTMTPNATSIATAAAPTLETDYSYDTLGNLLRVDQWGGPSGSSGDHVRTFTYDALSRLLSAYNPETGTISYIYDNNSNVLRKTDNRSISINYAYDALNRVLSKTYSDSTPAVAYTYDTSSISGSANDIGELTQATVQSGSTVLATTSTYAYDSMGRLQKEQQCTPANMAACQASPYEVDTYYDQGGKTISATFPSNAPATGTTTPDGQPVTFSYVYDNAERLLTAGSSWNASSDATHPATLFQASTSSSLPAYGPMGLQNASLGINTSYGTTTATLQRGYDNRSRVIYEADSAGSAIAGGTTSSGSFTITGSEGQVTKTNTPGSAALTIAGAEGSYQICTTNWQMINGFEIPVTTCNSYPDTGKLSVTVDGFTGSYSYGSGSTDPSVAAGLAAALNASGSPVTATASNKTVTITSIATGLSSNYPFTISNGIASDGYSDFSANSTSSALTGGWTAGTFYDTGTISVAVSDLMTAQVNWVQGSTPSNLAATLAASINGLEGIPGSSCPTAAQIASATGYVSACASGGTVTLTSLSKGPAVDWAVTASATDTNPTYFSASGPNNYQGPPSFAATATSMSGGEINSSVLYSYAISAADGYAPNGNLLSVADSVTGTWSYAYDNLNRVVTGTATAGSYAGAQMSWSYDPFGNRQSESVGGTIQSTCGPTPTMPLSSAASYTASNQVSSVNGGAGLAYDAAGDVLTDPLNSYLYDAEGRLCAAKTAGPSYTGYVYDAGGTRVAKGSLTSFSCNFSTNGFTPTTSWVLGPSGEQVTEYTVSGGTSTWKHTNAFAVGQRLATYTGADTIFALKDWLGSKRVEVGASGCATAYTSLAYGDGLTPVSLPGYASCTDATEHHFTAKERDPESGNDYFGARYYASTMGRFMSPDTGPYIVSDPQTLNRYAFTRDNPLKFVDPTGKYFVVAAQDQKFFQEHLRNIYSRAGGRALINSLAKSDRPVFLDRKSFNTKETGTAGDHKPLHMDGVSGVAGVHISIGTDTDLYNGEKMTHGQEGADKTPAHELEHANDALSKGQTNWSDGVAAAVKGDDPINPEAKTNLGGTLDGTAQAGANEIMGEKPDMSSDEANKDVGDILKSGNEQWNSDANSANRTAICSQNPGTCK